MTTWKDYVGTILYLHHRLLSTSILAIGGIVALWLVYIFLFTSAPTEIIQEHVGDTRVKQEALERVTAWNAKKREDGKIQTIVHGTVFAAPPSTP